MASALHLHIVGGPAASEVSGRDSEDGSGEDDPKASLVSDNQAERDEDRDGGLNDAVEVVTVLLGPGFGSWW